MHTSILEKLGLEANPFEPSATGSPLLGTLSLPPALAKQTEDLLDAQDNAAGVKAIILVGEYGIGKTCFLQWLHTKVLPNRQIKSFYFDNPGVQFYDLANRLLRTIGRKDFAKFIWELAGAHVSSPYQGSLFQRGYEAYLSDSFRRRRQQDMAGPLQTAIKTAGITTDEEIAHCLARIVTGVTNKPYFEYRDFIPRQQGSVVPEGEEAPYFRAILKTIAQGTGAKAIAFLIDEFEEIGLQKRLTRRAAHDYLATLKRLINLSEDGQVEFWIVLSMTPEAYEMTSVLEPPLVSRLSNRTLHLAPLTETAALDLIESRVAAARNDPGESLGPTFPFPDHIVFRPDTYSNPRRLVKTCFRAIVQWNDAVPLPFDEDYLHMIEDGLYPASPPDGSPMS